MVLKGQFLERMTPIAAGEPLGSIHLDGLYHRGSKRPAILIAPPHPRAGGSMETSLVAELAWALTRAGHPTLRFNYRGVGASRGEPGGTKCDIDDVLAALDHMVETEGGRIGLCGVGHGAIACAEVAAAKPMISSLAMIGPPALVSTLCEAAGGLAGREGGAPDLLLVLGEDDYSSTITDAFSSLRDVCTVEVLSGAGAPFLRGLPEAARVVAAFFSSPRQ